MEKHKKEILQLLRNGSNSPVILAGMEMGTATWMARQIIDQSATTSHGFCNESLWVSLAKYYDTRWLYKVIYDQLSSGSIPEEWEYEEDANTELNITAPDLTVITEDWEQEQENQNAEQEAGEETTIDNLKLKIQKQLDKRKPVLLVLDCEGHNMDDNEFKQNVLLAGHVVLMELIDRAILKMQENNIVVVEGAALNMIDMRPLGFGGTASLGLVRVFKKGEGFGRVTHIDGMIKTLCNPKNVKDVSTLLIDGAHPNRELHEEFFSSMSGLKVLGVFNSGYKPLISSMSGLKELDVLVLRNCDLLDDTTHISNLRSLRVLEISESRAGEYSSLMSMPENLLDEIIQLQSLNLSGLQIESLPSLSKLIELRLLILRRCSRLKKLQSLKGLANLETLDLSGSESFENFHDTSFSEIPNIQLIDFSHTKIQKVPVLGELKYLTRISLRGCSNKLRQLPRLQHLSSLQILDLSGASEFRNFMFKDLIAELNHLKVLNLSKTKISKLPPIPCNLSELNLSGCAELVELPSTIFLKNLELLDVSDAPKLAKINHESFQHLTYLRYINFSNTKVENLPTLSNLRNLRQVLLRNCTLLQNLPAMEGVTRLEELDLSGCSALQVNESIIDSFRINM
ncbi:hypothetical protein Dsin_023702 [Dipteronia sinensis]|uniref:Uncharacterized protein n=1 Tax=Dipteronia sinensis TaxID=43782 RepID=A0AAE0A4T3_9ROSI|nr:hypothetical protein Dsin_023702 [Dipteronia sinensis]